MKKRERIIEPSHVKFEIDAWLLELSEAEGLDVPVHEHVLQRFLEHLEAVKEDFGE